MWQKLNFVVLGIIIFFLIFIVFFLNIVYASDGSEGRDPHKIIIEEGVKKSDIFGWVHHYIEKFQDIIANLNLEQLVALFNIL
jgi:hypothetical protein